MQIDRAVQSFMNGYFSTCQRSRKTYAAYQLDLAQFRRWAGSGRMVESLDAPLLESWARHLVDQDYASASVRRKFATLKVFFSYWVRRGLLESSPMSRIRLDLATTRPLPRTISTNDLKRMIAEAHRKACFVPAWVESPANADFRSVRDLALVELLFATGMRIGELTTLRLRNLNDDGQTLVIDGKGSRQRMGILSDERSKRALRSYLSLRRGLRLNHDALFVSYLGGRLSTQGAALAVTKLAKRAGVETHITPHMFRHTVATLLLRHGADLRVVQEFLGHASITTTQRYTHITKEHLTASLRLHHPNHHLVAVT